MLLLFLLKKRFLNACACKMDRECIMRNTRRGIHANEYIYYIFTVFDFGNFHINTIKVMAHTLPPPATEDDKRSKASRKEKKAKKMTGLAIKYSRAIQFYQFTIPTIQLQQPNQERFFLFRRVHDFLLFPSNLFLFILHIFVQFLVYIDVRICNR